MRKRIANKIVRKFQRLDELLSYCFRHGGLDRYRSEIRSLRYSIQYLRRRWPNLYRKAFGMDLKIGEIDLGHLMSGR